MGVSYRGGGGKSSPSKSEIWSNNFASIGKSNACESAAEPLTVKLTGKLPAWAEAVASADPHLAAVLAAWATLPETVKADIVAMISDDGLLAVR
ncbi:MAG: hypothetical protein FWE88_02210 [Phycisphaerae bacterium]|nr:hypothetical protein [Phycisphaerae bacterium]